MIAGNLALLAVSYRGVEEVLCLGPGESCLYTWQKPLLKRVLLWTAGVEVEKQDELIRVRDEP